MAKQAAKAETKRYCYAFEEGDGTNKKLLGGKGAGLCTMTQIGLPVPPGFSITTEANVDYLEAGQPFPGRADERGPRIHGGPGEEDRQGVRRPLKIPCWSRCAPVPPCPCRA